LQVVETTSSEYTVQLKYRCEEADIIKQEETVKRLEIENEEYLIRIEMDRIDIEERRLVLLEQKKAAGIP
jgi:hypothetical protein